MTEETKNENKSDNAEAAKVEAARLEALVAQAKNAAKPPKAPAPEAPKYSKQTLAELQAGREALKRRSERP